MSTEQLEKRLRRRSIHRSRSTALAVTLVVVILVAAWIGTEAVLKAIGQGPLLADPQTVADTALKPDAAFTTIAEVIAAVLVIAGIVLVVLALKPGRQPRSGIDHDRGAVIIDTRILASTAANAAALAAASPRPTRVRRRVGTAPRCTWCPCPASPSTPPRWSTPCRTGSAASAASTAPACRSPWSRREPWHDHHQPRLQPGPAVPDRPDRHHRRGRDRRRGAATRPRRRAAVRDPAAAGHRAGHGTVDHRRRLRSRDHPRVGRGVHRGGGGNSVAVRERTGDDQVTVNVALVRDVIDHELADVHDIVSSRVDTYLVKKQRAARIRVHVRRGGDAVTVLDAVDHAVTTLDHTLGREVPVLVHLTGGTRTALARTTASSRNHTRRTPCATASSPSGSSPWSASGSAPGPTARRQEDEHGRDHPQGLERPARAQAAREAPQEDREGRLALRRNRTTDGRRGASWHRASRPSFGPVGQRERVSVSAAA